MARTSNEAIVAAARMLLEAAGPDAVTMQAVATAVGVRAPSLYKRFLDRAALLTAIADDVAVGLADATAPLDPMRDPRRTVRRMARRYRAFAHQAPRSYGLLFTSGVRPSSDTDALASAGILRVTARLAGPARALEAARLIVAYLHGFVSMELAGAFRLSGDVDRAFEHGIDAIIAGLWAPGPQRISMERRA